MGATEELADELRGVLGGAVDGLRRLSGGASRETWSFDARRAAADPAAAAAGRGHVGVDAQRGRRCCVPPPAPACRCPPSSLDATGDDLPLGLPAIVVEHVPGESIARKLLRDDEYAAVRPTPRRVVRPHPRRDPPAPDRCRRRPRPSPIRSTGLQATMDSLGGSHPAFELAFRWLDQHRPPPPPRSGGRPRRLPHRQPPRHARGRVGGPRLGAGAPRRPARGPRLVLRPGLALRGRRAPGRRVRRQGGAVGRLRGRRRRARRPRRGAVVGGVRHAALGRDLPHAGAPRTVSGSAGPSSWPTIGWRSCENEHDVLALLAPDRDPPPRPDRRSTPTATAPPAAELAEAVREWVAGDVDDATEGRVRFHARVGVERSRHDRAGDPARSHARRRARRPARPPRRAPTTPPSRPPSGRVDLDDRWDEVHAEVWAAARDTARRQPPRLRRRPARLSSLRRHPAAGVLGWTSPAAVLSYRPPRWRPVIKKSCGSGSWAAPAPPARPWRRGWHRSASTSSSAPGRSTGPWRPSTSCSSCGPTRKLKIGAGRQRRRRRRRPRGDRHAVGRRHPDGGLGRPAAFAARSSSAWRTR